MFSTFITFLRLRYKLTTLLHHTQDIHSGDFKVHFPFTFVYKNIFFKTCGHFLTRHFSGIGWRWAFSSPFTLKSKWNIILTGPAGSRTDHRNCRNIHSFPTLPRRSHPKPQTPCPVPCVHFGKCGEAARVSSRLRERSHYAYDSSSPVSEIGTPQVQRATGPALANHTQWRNFRWTNKWKTIKVFVHCPLRGKTWKTSTSKKWTDTFFGL